MMLLEKMKEVFMLNKIEVEKISDAELILKGDNCVRNVEISIRSMGKVFVATNGIWHRNEAVKINPLDIKKLGLQVGYTM